MQKKPSAVARRVSRRTMPRRCGCTGSPSLRAGVAPAGPAPRRLNGSALVLVDVLADVGVGEVVLGDDEGFGVELRWHRLALHRVGGLLHALHADVVGLLGDQGL